MRSKKRREIIMVVILKYFEIEVISNFVMKNFFFTPLGWLATQLEEI